MRSIGVWTVCAVLLAVCLSAQAAPITIAYYSYTSGDGPDTGVAANLTAGNTTRGAGLLAASGLSGLTGYFQAKDYSSTSAAAAVTNNDYVSIVLTVASGYYLNLDSVAFKVARTNSGPTDGFLRSSLDSYTGDLKAYSSISTGGNTQTATLDTTFDHIEGTVEFRWYGWRASGLSASHGSGLDNVNFVGEVLAIPEPATLALLGLGGVCGMLRRRR